MPIYPDNAKTPTRGWGGGRSSCLPRWRQAARTPNTHNTLASAQKNPTFIANNVPTYHHPCPPLPGKSDGERVKSANANTTWPHSGPGCWSGSCSVPVHRQRLRDVPWAANPSHSIRFLRGGGVTFVGLSLSDLRRHGKWRPGG